MQLQKKTNWFTSCRYIKVYFDFTVEATEQDVTPAPKQPKARTRLNLQAVKDAARTGSSTVVKVAAEVHAPAVPTRQSPRKKPASAPKDEVTV